MPAISLRELLNFSHRAAIAVLMTHGRLNIAQNITNIDNFFFFATIQNDDFITAECYITRTSYVANANDARDLQANRESLETQRKVGFRKPFLKLILHSGRLVLQSSRRNRACTQHRMFVQESSLTRIISDEAHHHVVSVIEN